MARILVLDDVDARHQVIVLRFPDDERVHAWNFAEAVAALGTGRFDLMLLDHDLGEERTGLDVAREIAALRSELRPLEAVIHSHNPVGAERMRDVLERAGVPTRLEPFSGVTRMSDASPRSPATIARRMDALLEACRTLPEDLPLESLLANLRVANASKIQSIAALHAVRAIEIAEARALVDASDTWADQRGADTASGESLIRAVKELLESARAKE